MQSPAFGRLFDPGASLRERGLLLWDLTMVALVSVNLALIIVDTLYVIGPIQGLLGTVWPSGHDAYKSYVHANFELIDLSFVAIFIVDVLAGWAVAVYQKRYVRWFFYPFVHWYDVLGCIPVAGFRFLRVLRLVSIVMRLQRLGVIDVRGWAIFRRVMVYYDILAEEITDRVVIKMISGAQDELSSSGSRIARRAITEVFEPRRQQLVERAATQLENVIAESYQASRADLQRYVADVVHRGVARNAAVRNMERLPVLGRTLNHALDDAIRDSVNSVLDEIIESCTRAEFERVLQTTIDEVIERLVSDEQTESSELDRALVETLELVKEQVAVKKWHGYFNTDSSEEDAEAGRDAGIDRTPADGST
ncbi:ion transporter [Salinisphaera orenii]|uniref:ion transporter n=1 Tax=Salinisphaera orenii TaxID=856731 RepID=UPI000DBE67CD